jgi:hypothetical protein
MNDNLEYIGAEWRERAKELAAVESLIAEALP